MGVSAEPTAAPTLMCSKCGREKRAIVRHRGKRKRAPLCKQCLRERQRNGNPPEAENEGASSVRSGEQPPAIQGAGALDGTAGHETEDVHGPNYCNAIKRDGKPCSLTAGQGTDHVGIGRCKFHGGSTPTHMHHAAKTQARMHAVTMGAPINIEPHDALLWCVRIAAGEVSYCNVMVAMLHPDDATGNTVSIKRRPLSHGKEGDSSHETVEETTIADPALHIWINTRREAIDRLAKFSKMAVDAGVAERQVQLAERYGEAIGNVVGRILDGLNLSATQMRKAPELVRMHLTSIEGTAEEAA